MRWCRQRPRLQWPWSEISEQSGVGRRRVGGRPRRLVATLGVVVYEIRNTQLYDAAVHRLKFLERLLDMPGSTGKEEVAGIFGERPTRPVIGPLHLWHNRGLALVYGAATAASASLAVSSARKLQPMGPEMWPELLVPLLAGGLVGGLLLARSTRDRPANRAVHLPGTPVIGNDAVQRLVDVVEAIQPSCNCRCKRQYANAPLTTDDGSWVTLAPALGLVSRKSAR